MAKRCRFAGHPKQWHAHCSAHSNRWFCTKTPCQAQHQKTMCKPRWHPQHFFILGGQFHAHPLAERGRTATNIHRHIEYRARHYTHQLTLRLLNLIMQAAQHALCRARVVVLYEVDIQTRGFMEGFTVITFEEKTTRIAKHFGFDDQYFGNGCRYYVHV